MTAATRGEEWATMMRTARTGLDERRNDPNAYPCRIYPHKNRKSYKYFEERNEAYLRNPKRAGKKIWRSERVEPIFNEANNCKDPDWR